MRGPARGIGPLRRTFDWLDEGRATGTAIVGLVTLAVCMSGIGAPALWWDEAATWSSASSQLGSLVRQMQSKDAVLGPYYLLEHVWLRLVGIDELALRFPSAVAMAVAAATVVVLGHRLVNWRAGVASGLIFALIPSVTRYGQEARPYALVCAFAALSTLALLVAIERSRRRWWLAYAVGLAAAGTFQVTAILLVGAHAVLAGRRQAMRSWLPYGVVGSVPTLILVGIGWSQRFAIEWIQPSSVDALAASLSTIVGGAAALAFVVAVLVVGARVRDSREPLAAAAVPVAALFVAGLLTPVFTGRYVLYVLPLGVVGIGAALGSLGRVRRIAALVALVLVCFADQTGLRGPAGHGIDARTAVSWIEARCLPGDVYVAYDLTALPVEFYASQASGCVPRRVSATSLGNASRVFIVRGEGSPAAAAAPGFRYRTGQGFDGIVVTLLARP